MTVVAEKPAAPAVKRARRGWTQAQVAVLVGAHARGVSAATLTGRSAEECTAKLIELGLEKKPEPVVLTDAHREYVEKFAGALGGLPEPQRTLAVRHAVKSLSALLPKRVVKESHAP
jgi:hypothetical protein